MSLWIVFAVLCLVALAFVVLPLMRSERQPIGLVAFLVVGVVALSSGLYYLEGRPDVESGPGGAHGMEDVVAALAERLASNPDDANGWRMLGRSYMSLRDFDGAIEAFEKANQLESGHDAPTLVALGEAKMSANGGELSDEIDAVFETALAVDPNSPQALFYAGWAAAESGDTALGASRWDRLLSLNPPAEIEHVLRQKIAEWRGEAPPPAVEAPAPAAVAAEPVATPDDAIVRIELSLSDEARAALPDEAGIFIIARDPAQPSPPIAVSRRRLSELPVTVFLSDRESMVAGRNLSGFAEFEVLARVSLSGQPMQQSGDWYAATIVAPADSAEVSLVIDTQVP